MSKRLTVTAVVPSYGRPDSLLRCLGGLLAGERVPDEIVVVLRESDEESREALADWLGERAGQANHRRERLAHPDGRGEAEQHLAGERHRALESAPTADGERPRAEVGRNLAKTAPTGGVPAGEGLVKLVLVTEPGQIAAMNAGLAEATGDIVTFPDDDCVPRPDWLRRVTSHYADPAVGGSGGRDVVNHATAQPPPPTVATVGKLTWYGKVIGNHHCETTGGPRAVDHLKGVNMSFRRELLVPFDPHIRGPHFNDTDIALSVSRSGWKLIYDPAAQVDHYPAERPDSPGGRDLQDLRLTRLDAHDWMYLVLKHQPWALKGISACYILLVGTRLRPGLLTGLALGLVRPRTVFPAMGAALRGALSGIATWARRRSGATGQRRQGQ